MKPGWQTTEFWVTIVANVIAVVVVLGFIPAQDGESLKDSLTVIVEGVFSAVVAATSIWNYIDSRRRLKEKDAEIQATKRTY